MSPQPLQGSRGHAGEGHQGIRSQGLIHDCDNRPPRACQLCVHVLDPLPLHLVVTTLGAGQGAWGLSCVAPTRLCGHKTSLRPGLLVRHGTPEGCAFYTAKGHR